MVYEYFKTNCVFINTITVLLFCKNRRIRLNSFSSILIISMQKFDEMYQSNWIDFDKGTVIGSSCECDFELSYSIGHGSFYDNNYY